MTATSEETMGGKRPDRHQIDPAATDYKTRVEDEGITEREKHELTTQEHEHAEGMIPKRGENPVRGEVRARKGRSRTKPPKEE